MNAAVVTETDLREKIKTVMFRLDSMESRVRDVETTTAAVSRLEKNLANVISRVEKVESRMEPNGRPVEPMEKFQDPQKEIARAPLPPAPPPVKAFVSGVSLGLLIIGLVAAVWLLGLL